MPAKLSDQTVIDCSKSGQYAKVVVTEGPDGVHIGYWGFRESVDYRRVAALQTQYPDINPNGWQTRSDVVIAACQAYIFRLRDHFLTFGDDENDTYAAIDNMEMLVGNIQEDPPYYRSNWLRDFMPNVQMAIELAEDSFFELAWNNMLTLVLDKLMPFWALDRLHSERAALSTDNYAPARSR